MVKPRRDGLGFSGSRPVPASKQQRVASSADQGRQARRAAALIDQGNIQEAEAIYRDLIAAGSRDHGVYANLASICGLQGRVAEVIELLNKALEIKPDYPGAHNSLGKALKAHGNPSAAIESFRTALELKPDYAAAHYNLGLALKEQGDLDAAIVSYTTALKLKPNDPDAHNSLGVALQEQGNRSAAIASYTKALEQRPNDPAILNNLGVALKEQGDLAAAIASYAKALELSPHDPVARRNLGVVLQEQGDLPAAIASYRKALQLSPNDPDALLNLGVALQEQGNLRDAIAACRQSLDIRPHCSDAHHNLGVALEQQGDLPAAIACYHKALELKPHHAGAHSSLGMTELLAGDYKSGWRRYGYRFQAKACMSIFNARPGCDRWHGDHLNANDQLLLVSEQGLGDTLQFMRYAIALRNKGLSVALCAPAKLHGLIQISGLDSSPLTPEQGNAVADGVWIPLLSVPGLLEVSPDNPIITEPYIKTSDALITKWADRLAGERRPIIGINWQGNPDHERTTSRGRSLTLEAFAPIAQSTNATFLSLQKGFGSEQLVTCSFRDHFVHCQPEVDEAWDFLDSAAIIANCDLVITSDTSVAHLAGGMGLTTWLLLKQIPEWRWGLEGETSFWYPSMRLFRQVEPGNWDELLERVAAALQDEFPLLSAASRPGARAREAQTAFPTESSTAFSAATSAAAGSTKGLQIQAPVSLGELVDKITILQIKASHLQGVALNNVEMEWQVLQDTLDGLDLELDPTLVQRLQEVNADLWRIEDEIREKERNKDFGDGFIQLARSVYQRNDRRAALKKEINTTYGSALVEEKSYHDY